MKRRMTLVRELLLRAVNGADEICVIRRPSCEILMHLEIMDDRGLISLNRFRSVAVVTYRVMWHGYEFLDAMTERKIRDEDSERGINQREERGF